MLPQFASQIGGIKLRNLLIGGTIFFLGLFKKVIIADGVSPYSDTVFAMAANGEVLTLLESWTGALAYSIQLYFDFSGYSDMAIGLARMFGVRLPLNFNSPYKAANIIEFWRPNLYQFDDSYVAWRALARCWLDIRSVGGFAWILFAGQSWLASHKRQAQR